MHVFIYFPSFAYFEFCFWKSLKFFVPVLSAKHTMVMFAPCLIYLSGVCQVGGGILFGQTKYIIWRGIFYGGSFYCVVANDNLILVRQ